MYKRKFAPFVSIALAAALCLSACGNTKTPSSSSTPDNSAAVDVPPSDSIALEDMVTPEEMANMVADEAGVLTDRTLTSINNSNANWFNLYGERVALVIVPSMEDGVSIDMVGEEYIGKMELNDKDSMLVINADTGDSILMVGEQSLLMGSGVMPNLEQGLELDDAIFNKFLEISNTFLTLQNPSSTTEDTGEEETTEQNTDGAQGDVATAPSEEDIAVGEEIYENIETVLEGKGMPALIDISGIGGNLEAFPESTIKETSDGHIKYQVLKGSTEDCDNCWFWYYNKVTGESAALDENGKTTFVQAFNPSNLYEHKIIAGTVTASSEDGSSEQTYYRAESIGNIVVAASAAPEYAKIIDNMFKEFGFPENNNVVY